MAKSLAGEWSPYGVRINVVAPGGIVTPRALPKNLEAERETMGLVLMRRGDGIDDLAKAITFFLSDLSTYATG